jgi:leucyl/phenylalanyl-tRNA--protein transferase
MTIYQLDDLYAFPDPTEADDEGLLAIGGDLTTERLLLAYSKGIFPWFSDDHPILWWSPNPRLVIEPAKIHISKSLKRTLKNHKFTVKFDERFHEVIKSCANTNRPGQDGTWITTEMAKAYIALYELGYAHSVETYYKEQLVGGLYGVSLGNAFFGESMYSLKSDASKVALVSLSLQLQRWNFSLIDCQLTTTHLLSMGAFEIKRDEFLQRVESAMSHQTLKGKWKFDLSEY